MRNFRRWREKCSTKKSKIAKSLNNRSQTGEQTPCAPDFVCERIGRELKNTAYHAAIRPHRRAVNRRSLGARDKSHHRSNFLRGLKTLQKRAWPHALEEFLLKCRARNPLLFRQIRHESAHAFRSGRPHPHRIGGDP